MNANDELSIRCPRLGGEVPFTYCLREGGTLPCHRIVSCWRPYFPIETLLQKRLSPQQWQEFERRKPGEKLDSLLELIDAAKRSAETKE